MSKSTCHGGSNYAVCTGPLLPRALRPKYVPQNRILPFPELELSTFRNVRIFYSEKFLVPLPNTKLVDCPLSVVRDCYPVYLQLPSVSSFRNPKTRHIEVAGAHLSRAELTRSLNFEVWKADKWKDEDNGVAESKYGEIE
jgi:hypothetical protein